MKKALYGLLQSELQDILSGEPSFRSRQLFHALYGNRGEALPELSDITVLSKPLREKLSADYELINSSVEQIQHSDDDSKKFLIRLVDDTFIEAVLMHDGKDRKTVCLSTQVGCRMGCAFCQTGSLGLTRQLTAGEILQQLYHIEIEYGRVNNIVFMGMGEPLDNFDNLIKSLKILIDEKGLNMGCRKITLSTCGLGPKIHELALQRLGVRLAVSLNSAITEKRMALMPINKSTSLVDLKTALLDFQLQNGGKRLTLEYVMLQNYNIGREDASALIKFAKGLKVLINLIPLNPGDMIPYERPTDRESARFEAMLQDGGLNVTMRRSKGGTVSGACGQLAGTKKN